MPVVRDGRRQLSTFDVALVGGGSGPVERRVAGDGERDGFTSRIPLAGLPRAAARPVLLPSPEPQPAPVTPPEEPTVAIDPPPPVESRSDLEQDPPIDPFATALWAVRDAADEAAEAWSMRVEAEQRWRGAEAAFRASVEALAQPIRPDVLAAIEQLRTPPERTRVVVDEPALEEEYQAAREDEAVSAALRDDRLDEPSDDAPEIVTRRAEPEPIGQPGLTAAETRRAAAGGGPGRKRGQRAGGRTVELPNGLTRRQADVLAVVSGHSGDRKAAARELGITFQSVEGILETIGRRGLLPADLIAKLPSRFATFRSA